MSDTSTQAPPDPTSLDDLPDHLRLLVDPNSIGPNFDNAIDTLNLRDSPGDRRLAALAGLVVLAWAVSGDGENTSGVFGDARWSRGRLDWVGELITENDVGDRWAQFNRMTDDQIANAFSEVQSFMSRGVGLSKESLDEMEFRLSQGAPVAEIVSRVVGGVHQVATSPEHRGSWDIEDGRTRVAYRRNRQLAPFLETEAPDLHFVGEYPQPEDHRPPGFTAREREAQEAPPALMATLGDEMEWLNAQTAEAQREVVGNMIVRLGPNFVSRLTEPMMKAALLGRFDETEAGIQSMTAFSQLRDEVLGVWWQAATSAQSGGLEPGASYLPSHFAGDLTAPGWEQGYLDEQAAARASKVSPLTLYDSGALEDLVEREFTQKLGRAARPAEIEAFVQGARAAQREQHQARVDGVEHEGYDPAAAAAAAAEEADPARAQFNKYHDAADDVMEAVRRMRAG
ncbi:MAG: hypothetical protein OXG44_21570 [Gammaproteobacteria bacterium]|nr:hypothetical protein [Gammaproteobacteria bacterium]